MGGRYLGVGAVTGDIPSNHTERNDTMKKTISLLLTLVMAFSFTTCGFAAASPPTSVTIMADKSFTKPVSTSTEAVVSGLYALITSAKKSSVQAADVKELAMLVFSTPVSGNQVKDAPHTIYQAADGALYILKSKKLYQIDADAFYRLADESGSSFYSYRPIPTAKLGGSNLPMMSSSYQFKKLDGLFYKTKFTPPDEMMEMDDSGVIQTPKFSVEPKSVKVAVISNSDKKTVWSGTLAEVKNFEPEQSGSFTVKYTAMYDSAHYKGEVVYQYEPHFSVRPKNIQFFVEGNVTAPGEAVFLKAWNIPADGKITVKSDIQFTPHFFRQANGDMVALFPVSYYTAAGNHYIELSSGGVTQKFTLDTKSKKFVEQYLTVPASTVNETINSQKANDEFEQNIAPIRYVSDNKQYWSGRFIWPLKNSPRRTTEFGTIRYTNGDTKNPSRHGAIDFAAAAGTPVYAPANGRVLYAGFLQLTGNTICIEHGYGLKTWYYHMNGLNVKTNEMVKQSQQIGIVGSTGFSTGAHLHYGMSISNTTSGNVWINPETATTTDLFAAFPSEYTLG